MLSPSDISSLAQRLRQARADRRPMGQPSKSHPDMTIGDAYAVQRAWVALEQGQGRVAKGHKIGLTSRAIQQTFVAKEPTHAPLMDDMFFEAGGELPLSRFIAPRMEAELAFVLGKPLRGPGLSLFDVLQAVDYVIPAVEIIDSRVELVDPATKTGRAVTDQIADFGTCAGIILSSRLMDARRWDLRRVGALVERNGATEETGLSAAVLNHPLNAVAWLANFLSTDGHGLEAGELVLAGSFTKPLPIHPGDTLHVNYGDMGSISFRCGPTGTDATV